MDVTQRIVLNSILYVYKDINISLHNATSYFVPFYRFANIF